MQTKRYMYRHDRQAHAWTRAFNLVDIKTRANWRARLRILGGGTRFDFCFRQVRQDEVAYGAEGDSATPDGVLVV